MDCSDLGAQSVALSADCLQCSGQHQLDDMLTVTMAANAQWLAHFLHLHIICAGRGWADTVWIVTPCTPKRYGPVMRAKGP